MLLVPINESNRGLLEIDDSPSSLIDLMYLYIQQDLADGSDPSSIR